MNSSGLTVGKDYRYTDTNATLHYIGTRDGFYGIAYGFNVVTPAPLVGGQYWLCVSTVERAITDDVAERRQSRAAKRKGWRIAEQGGMLCDCGGDPQSEAGWWAQRAGRLEDSYTGYEFRDMAHGAVAGLVEMFGVNAFV